MSSFEHSNELKNGDRFSFGENWLKFFDNIDEFRIRQAEASLKTMLEVEDLHGKSFLDIGCGSGLFSLAARRLGANVHSFDFDKNSVLCTRQLKNAYFSEDPNWLIEEGSVLDDGYLEKIGTFDIVYSWGVLHHTGEMWRALQNVDINVIDDGGILFIALYNDQGSTSKTWWKIKKMYVTLPPLLRFLVVWPSYLRLWGPTMVRDFIKFKPFATWRNYKIRRGMTPHRDVIDWVGGFPFEVSKPEDIFEFYKARGYVLTKLVTAGGGLGCNQFVFKKSVLNVNG